MRSRLTARPAVRAAATAVATFSGWCVRSSAASTCGTADCMPIERRVTPAAASVVGDRGGHGVGVRLDRDLGAGREPERVAHTVEHPREIARRAGASACRRRRRPCRRGTEGPGVRRARGARARSRPTASSAYVVLPRAAQLGRRVGVEVAVAAAHAAERNVQVDPEVGVEGRREVAGQRAVGGCGITEREAEPPSGRGRVQRRDRPQVPREQLAAAAPHQSAGNDL